MHVVDVACIARLEAPRTNFSEERESLTEAMKGHWVDFTQAIQHKPHGALATLNQTGLNYSFEKNIVLSGWAHMKILGLPDQVSLLGLSDREVRSLAGEAFSAPDIITILFAYYANPFAPWWTPAAA